ncbi:MAG: helix-turn-helix domain containing protein [Opitutaceae bacterium]|nr:helix-turn-helix domain containing protein [Opitutaceae bacterium]
MWREFVEFAEKGHEPFTAICARFGISRKTGYKWLNRFRAEGEAGLVELSRRPKTLPRKTPDAVEEMVISLRAEYPNWSAARISAEIQVRGIAPVPAPSTIDLILRRRREIVAQRQAAAGALSDAVRFEPNFRWTIRLLPDVRISGSGAMTPVAVEDDVTQFIIGTFLIPPSRKDENLRAGIEAILRRHGMPWRMALAVPHIHSVLTVWLMRLEIGVDFVPASPIPVSQAQSGLLARLSSLPAYQRTAVERQVRPDPLAGVCGQRYESERHALNALEAARTRHNFGQTQESLQTRTPISLYRPSPREVPDEIAAFAYPSGAEVRLVSEKGIFTFQRKLIHVGRAFAGLEVEIRPLPTESRHVVLLGTHVLGQVDLLAHGGADTTSAPLVTV